jgi:hypothetical protein
MSLLSSGNLLKRRLRSASCACKLSITFTGNNARHMRHRQQSCGHPWCIDYYMAPFFYWHIILRILTREQETFPILYYFTGIYYAVSPYRFTT